MRVNLLTLSRRVASWGFLVLFPGFVLYHYSLANGWIPPFLGGLFGAGTGAVALYALMVVPWIATRQLRGVSTAISLVTTTVVYLGVWSVANYYFLRSAGFADDAFRQSVLTLVLWTGLLFIGWFANIDSRSWRVATIVLCILIIGALVHAMVRFSSPLGPWATFASQDDDSQFSTYQAIGRSLLVCSIIVASFCRTDGRRLAVLAVGCVSLLLVGSRSDFFSLGIVTFLLTMRVLYQNRGNVFGVGGAAVLVAVGLALWPIFLETRNAEILDLSQSSSWQARVELQVAALDVIRHQPIFGDFGYYLRDGGAGAYSHNALSAWTNFGVVGFTLFVGVLVYMCGLSAVRWLIRGENGRWFIAFNLNLVALVQAIVASPVFAVLPGLAWGVTLSALRQDAAAGSPPPEAVAVLPSVQPAGGVTD